MDKNLDCNKTKHQG